MSISELLSNIDMSSFENFVIWANLAGAISATFVNFLASAKGIPRMRKVHWLVGSLALIYSVAYLILLCLDPGYLEWSSVMRGVAVLVWIIVWAAPALASYRIWRDFPKYVEEALQERLNEISRGD